MEQMNLLIALCAGISLSAAAGFRVFLPLLALSIAVHFGGYTVNEHLAWIGSNTALYTLLTASVVEVLAYYIPAVDNLLDTVSGPLALAAGAVITAGLLPEMPDVAQWAIGIIAGSGAAGVVQAGTTAARGASTTTTAGTGNFLVASAENVLSTVGSVLALLLPLVAIFGVVFFVWVLWRVIRRLRRNHSSPATS